MPLGNARSLDDQTYLDVVAYILQFNGIPAGNQKLVNRIVPALEKITIEITARLSLCSSWLSVQSPAMSMGTWAVVFSSGGLM